MNSHNRIRTSIVTLVSVLCLHSSPAVIHAQDKQAESIVLTEGTTLNVVTAQPLSSKTAKPGDPVNFKVDEDVAVNGQVLISKGTPVQGSVINAEPSGHLGKSGKLGIAVESTTTVDGRPIKLRAAKGSEGKDKTTSTMVLTTVVSSLFLLKKGTNAEIAEGTRVTVYVAEEKHFRVADGALVADNPVPKADAAADLAASQPATVFIYRPGKMVGKALEPSVFCDDKELARMDNGRYFALRLTPGKHLIHMTDDKKGYAIDMGPGQTYFFRVGVEMGMWKGHGKLTLEDAEKALPEIKKLKFIGQDKIKDHTMVVEVDPNKPAP